MNTTKSNKILRLRDCLNAAAFLTIIGIFFILNIVVRPPAILISERRAPAKLPAFTYQTVVSGSFMSRFEEYAADSFVFRDGFRMLKAEMVFNVFKQSDKSGLYFGQAGAGEYKRLNPLSAKQSAEKIRKVADAIDGCSIYYSIIPDKSIYAGKYLPGFELSPVERILSDAMGAYTYIPLQDCLEAASFYKTDLHWDQPMISAVMERLSDAMGVKPDIRGYEKKDAGAFKGAYAGQMALPMDPDQLVYMDSPALRASRLNDVTLVFEECPVYDLARLSGVDPYDVFLRGPEAIVIVENADVPEGELYLFRDSFGSSLAPLLASAYRKVTLIDLRYIDARVLDQFVEFTPGADVLFLYSSMILNNPSILKA